MSSAAEAAAGSVDYIAIYGRALTGAEVADLARIGVPTVELLVHRHGAVDLAWIGRQLVADVAVEVVADADAHPSEPALATVSLSIHTAALVPSLWALGALMYLLGFSTEYTFTFVSRPLLTTCVPSGFHLAKVNLGQNCALRLKAQRSVQHADHAADGDERGRYQQHANGNLSA